MLRVMKWGKWSEAVSRGSGYGRRLASPVAEESEILVDSSLREAGGSQGPSGL